MAGAAYVAEGMPAREGVHAGPFVVGGMHGGGACM